MPRLFCRRQGIEYFERDGYNELGEPKYKDGVALKSRIEEDHEQEVSTTSTFIRPTTTVYVDQELKVDSLLILSEGFAVEYDEFVVDYTPTENDCGAYHKDCKAYYKGFTDNDRLIYKGVAVQTATPVNLFYKRTENLDLFTITNYEEYPDVKRRNAHRWVEVEKHSKNINALEGVQMANLDLNALTEELHIRGDGSGQNIIIGRQDTDPHDFFKIDLDRDEVTIDGKSVDLYVDNIAALENIDSRIGNGSLVKVLGYDSVADGGDQIFIYRSTGRSSISTLAYYNKGWYFPGGGTDDYFETLNKTYAYLPHFGVRGASTDTERIKAAIDTQKTVVGSCISATLTSQIDFKYANQRFYGNGITLKSTADMASVLKITAKDVYIESTTVDADGDTVTYTGSNGYCVRIETTGGNATLKAVTLQNSGIIGGVGVPNILTLADGFNLDSCISKNPGFACYRLDSSGTVHNCQARIDTARTNSAHRWFVGNASASSGARQLVITGGLWSFDATYTSTNGDEGTILDFETGTDLPHVVIRDVHITTDGLTANANSTLIKVENADTVLLEGIRSDSDVPVFTRPTANGVKLQSFDIVNCQFKRSAVSVVILSGGTFGRVKLENCFLEGSEDPLFGLVTSVDYLIVRDCLLKGYRYFTTTACGGKIECKNTHLLYTQTTNDHWFRNTTDREYDTSGFVIEEDTGAGTLYLSDTNSHRMIVTGTFHEMYYDHHAGLYRKGATGFVGTRSTAATSSHEQHVAANVGDAFTNIDGTGITAMRIVNMNPSNGQPAAWIWNTTSSEWEPEGGTRIVRVTGTPESSVDAAVGTLALRDDGGAGTTLYVKESGTGNTGWVGK